MVQLGRESQIQINCFCLYGMVMLTDSNGKTNRSFNDVLAIYEITVSSLLIVIERSPTW
jgi:hypothetical protein